jgi:hypothetical protein
MCIDTIQTHTHTYKCMNTTFTFTFKSFSRRSYPERLTRAYTQTCTQLLHRTVQCSEVRTGSREIRRRRAKTDSQRCCLITINHCQQNNTNKWVKQNPIIPAYRCTSTRINNYRQGHGGNRGLNTQHVMMELKPGVWEDKTKQMERWINDG